MSQFIFKVSLAAKWILNPRRTIGILLQMDDIRNDAKDEEN